MKRVGRTLVMVPVFLAILGLASSSQSFYDAPSGPLLASAAAPESPGITVVVLREEVVSSGPYIDGETTTTAPVTLYLAPDAARQDRGEISHLLRCGEAAPCLLIRLDHRTRTFQEYPLPIRIEDHLNPRSRAMFDLVAPREAAVRLSAAPPETVPVDGRTTLHRRLEGRVGPFAVRADVWLAELDVPTEIYWRLFTAIASLDPYLRGWVDDLVEPGRFPVRSALRRDQPRQLDRVHRRELTGLRREPPPAGLFAVPDGYRRLPSECFTEIAFSSTPEECPSP